MKQMPRIDKVMSPMPVTVTKDTTIKVAYEKMKQHHLRHLPVMDAEKLVGVLTDRDVKLATSLNCPADTPVENVMTPDPFTAKPQTALDHVTAEMAEHKYGCVIVQQENGKVVGIFTANDGLRTLGEILQEHYKQQ